MEQTSNYHHLQIGTKVSVSFMNENVKGELRGEILSVHFHPGKVRYDIQIETWKEDLMDGEGTIKQYYTRLYNVEAMFVSSGVLL
jgi:hypothetical protein